MGTRKKKTTSVTTVTAPVTVVGNKRSAKNRGFVKSSKPKRILDHSKKNNVQTKQKNRPKLENASIELGSEADPLQVFKWLISPYPANNFMEECWERKPCYIKRSDRNYYQGWFSKKDFDRLLKDSFIKYGVNLDVVRYVDNKKEVMTPTGRAYPRSVWQYFDDGYSLRLLNPHTYCTPVWKLLSHLQEYFTCGMGVNMYLTPKNSQGFAPHYDDIEAFILQLEGTKQWRVYKPLKALPKYSSRNLKQEEIGEAYMDIVLKPGEMLYFPRGWIHQGITQDSDSLHITVSTYQDNSWGTLMEKALPLAIENMFKNNRSLRQGLPIGYLDYMGMVGRQGSSLVNAFNRKNFQDTFKGLCNELSKHVDLDEAVDQLGIKFIKDCYRPALSDKERQLSIASGVVYGIDESPMNKEEEDKCCYENDHEFDSATKFRIARKHIARFVKEKDVIVLYHYMENARLYREYEAVRLEFPADPETEKTIVNIISSYPAFKSIDDINGCKDISDCYEIVYALYDQGLLVKQSNL